MVLVGGRVAALLLLAASAVPVHASLAQDVSGHAVSYQFDGGSHHDAPDACQEAGAQWSAPVGGATDGLLVPGDDMSDVFVLDVPPALLGQRVEVAVAEAAGTPDVAVTAFAPGCATDVFDLANQPSPPPSPPAPAEGERQQALADPAEPWACEERVWTFLISDVSGDAPASIHVAWTDGSQRTVPLAGQHHTWAWYQSRDALGILLKGAWANLPVSWGGDFALAQGDCEATDGGAVYGSPAMDLGSRLAFTPVRPGPHLVQVFFSGQPPATAVAATCHFCLPQVEQAADLVSYRLTAGVSASQSTPR